MKALTLTLCTVISFKTLIHFHIQIHLSGFKSEYLYITRRTFQGMCNRVRGRSATGALILNGIDNVFNMVQLTNCNAQNITESN